MILLSNATSLALLLGLLGSGALATNDDIGCKNCVGVNKDEVRLGCFESCSAAFTASSREHRTCRDYCTQFVFDHNCCSGSCPGDINTCMNEFWPTSRSATKKLARELDSGFEDSEPNLDEELAERDPARICCKVASGVMKAAADDLIPFVTERRWNDDTKAALILQASSMALSFACKTIFRTDCEFDVPARDDEDGGNGGGENAEVPLGGGPMPGRDDL